jgi:hypothetical protein
MSEYYADYDEDTALWCVFHTEKDDFAFATFADEQSAKDKAAEYNKGPLFDSEKYYIVNCNESRVVSEAYDTFELADDAALRQFKVDDYWPYSVWRGYWINRIGYKR